MSGRSIGIGIGTGLLMGLTLVAWLAPPEPPPARPLPEDLGRITRVVMQYNPGADVGLADVGEAVAEVYRQFLTSVGPGVQVVWVVGSRRDLDDLRERLRDAYPTDSRVLVVAKPITTWSKDRFTCLVHEGGAGRAVLVAPARKAVSNPLRTHDQEVPWRLAAAFGGLFTCRDMLIDFDGGDILATSRGVFVHPAVLSKNDAGDSRFTSADALREHVRALLGEVVWLGPAVSDVPPHHVGMFLTVANGKAFVGDVRLAERLVASHEAELASACRRAGGLADAATRAELARQLDRIADQLRSRGLEVVRVPLMPPTASRAWPCRARGDSRPGG